MSRTTIFFIVVGLLSVGCFKWYNYYEFKAALPFMGDKLVANSIAEAEKKGITTVADFEFENQDGEPISREFVADKIWVADFFFTRCPSICPEMSNHLKQVQEEFSKNDDVRIISFSCDPEHDRPDKLKDYAERYQADPEKWQFATGEKVPLYRFARNELQIVATDGDGGPGDFIHSQNLVLIDQLGYVRGYYDGTNKEQVDHLMDDIKKLR